MKLLRTMNASGSCVKTAYGFSMRMCRTTSPRNVARHVQLAVDVVEEEDVLRARPARRLALLVAADADQVLRRHPRVGRALRAVGADQVVERPAFLRPEVRRARRAEVGVVRVRGDHERGLVVGFGQRSRASPSCDSRPSRFAPPWIQPSERRRSAKRQAALDERSRLLAIVRAATAAAARAPSSPRGASPPSRPWGKV